MPYFIYKITSGSTGAVKELEFIEKYDEFEAEHRLRESREAPILREWEK